MPVGVIHPGKSDATPGRLAQVVPAPLPRPGTVRSICLVLASIVALAFGPAWATAAVPSRPTWQPTRCKGAAVSADVTSRLRCGVVEVPRDRAKPDGPTFRLAVVVITAIAAHPEHDPVVYIAGGPGSPLTSDAAAIAVHQASVLAPDRDLVLVDQRGAGRSEPSLCSGLAREQLALFAAGLDTRALVRARQASFAGCRRAMDDADLRPEWFGTQVTAADLDDVRRALKFERWSVYALSYGTAVALTMLARYPETLRAVVLDSVYPPDPLPMTKPQSFARALDLLFASCQTDPACAAVHPDLARTYVETGERLDVAPLSVTLPPGLGVDAMMLRGAVFRLIVDRLLYSRPGMASLPAFIQAMHDRDAVAAQVLVGRVAQGFAAMSLGIAAAVECRDRSGWRLPDQAGDAALLVSAFDGEGCADWSPLGPPILAVRDTTVPTLILSGQADPITPPVFAHDAAGILGVSSRVVSFAHVGHGAEEATPCGERLVAAFMHTAKTDVDAACAAEIPPVAFR